MKLQQEVSSLGNQVADMKRKVEVARGEATRSEAMLRRLSTAVKSSR
jgi:peptidoglycan hydrolase CwlO-like protein